MDVLYRLAQYIEDACISYSIKNENINGCYNTILCSKITNKKNITTEPEPDRIQIRPEEFFFINRCFFDLGLSLCESRVQVQDMLYFLDNSLIFQHVISRGIKYINDGYKEGKPVIIITHDNDTFTTVVNFNKKSSFEDSKVKFGKLACYYKKLKMVKDLYHIRLICLTNMLDPMFINDSIFGCEIKIPQMPLLYRDKMDVFIENKNIGSEVYRYLLL